MGRFLQAGTTPPVGEAVDLACTWTGDTAYVAALFGAGGVAHFAA